MAYEQVTNAEGVAPATQVVVGLFKNATDAHQAVTQLKASGFSASQIGAAFRNESTADYADRDDSAIASTSDINRTHESWWDKLKDAFSSDDHAEHHEGADSYVAADASANTGRYTPADYEYDYAKDDFEGSLAGAGIPADRASFLSRSLEPGGAIVTVRDADRAGEAEQILSDNHGQVRYEEAADMGVARTNVASDMAASGTAAYDTDVRPVAAAETGVDRLQLFGEVLRVHKERINSGEVRIRKEIITETQTINVPVTREELVLERVAVPANTPAPGASIGAGQEIRIPLSEEKAHVEKQAVVREEVVVGKRTVEDVATVGDDVRHEELRVDSTGDVPRRTATGEDLPDDLRRHG